MFFLQELKEVTKLCQVCAKPETRKGTNNFPITCFECKLKRRRKYAKDNRELLNSYHRTYFQNNKKKN